ncbi:hypothetical protein V6N13_130576 [Hibiscus sabdariffa]
MLNSSMDGVTRRYLLKILSALSLLRVVRRGLISLGGVGFLVETDPEPLGHEIAEDVFCVLAVAEANAVSIVENLLRILREGNAKSKATAANVF